MGSVWQNTLESQVLHLQGFTAENRRTSYPSKDTGMRAWGFQCQNWQDGCMGSLLHMNVREMG